MIRKTMLLAVVVASLAAIAAPAAQAKNPLITDGLGNGLPAVTATSTNTAVTTGGVQLKCTTVTLAVELETNTNTTAFGFIVGTGTGRPSVPSHIGPCELTPSGLKVDVEAITGQTHLDDNAGGTKTANLGIGYTITHPVLGPIKCQFAAPALTVAFATATDKISVSGNVETTSPAPCPGAGEIKGDYTLTDAEEQPAFIG